MKMNVKLLRKIAAVIQDKPREFNMRRWHFDKKAVSEWDSSKGISVDALCDLPKDRQITCSTTHCIAGWAQVLSPHRNCKEEAEWDAERLLGLDYEQAQRLFYADQWPKGFGGWGCKAEQAADRIEHFIATKGRE